MNLFSVGKLLWIQRGCHERRVRNEMRGLINAAAASAGGEAMKMRYEALESELQRLGNGVEKQREPVSQTPHSQEEFEAMLSGEQ